MGHTPQWGASMKTYTVTCEVSSAFNSWHVYRTVRAPHILVAALLGVKLVRDASRGVRRVSLYSVTSHETSETLYADTAN